MMWSTSLLLILSLYARDIPATTTHWVVTEAGLLEPKTDSPFLLTRPDDIMTVLNQASRWENIIFFYHDLPERLLAVKNIWSSIVRDTDFSLHFAQDWSCQKCGNLQSVEWYASHLEDGSVRNIPFKEYMFDTIDDLRVGNVPNCRKIMSLRLGAGKFDHLEGVYNKGNLSMSAENSLPEKIASLMNIDQFGHWLNRVLKMNTSSWLHYNMASLFWRSKGNAPNAMECSQRAVHFAPRMYKGVALLNMGTILHKSKRPEEAISVLTSSIEYEPLPMAHYTIANAYAIVGDLETSLKHYSQSLTMDPSNKLASKNMHGVRCFAALKESMQDVKKNINILKDLLNEYGIREYIWLQQQASLLRNMQHLDGHVSDYKIESVCKKIGSLTGLDVLEVKKRGYKPHLINYYVVEGRYNTEWMHVKGVLSIESLMSLRKTVDTIEREVHTPHSFHEDLYVNDINLDGKFVEVVLPHTNFYKTFTDKAGEKYCKTNKKPNTASKKPNTASTKDTKAEKSNADTDFETGALLYPNTMKVSRNTHDFDKDAEWPSKKLCEEPTRNIPDNLENIYEVFMPFENKGIRVQGVLTDMIGVPASMEHELPWHPPTCPQDKAAATLKKSQKLQMSGEVAKTDHLRLKLLEYVGDGDIESVKNIQDAELGQRIHSAIKKNVAPKWVVYTLASLYWRVRDNKMNAVHCLLTASRTVKTRNRDLVMTSLASVYLEMGYYDEALIAADEAFRLSLYEPATNFVLAELNMIKQHRNTHMFHLKQVVRVEPNFMNGLARDLLFGWACESRYPRPEPVPEKSETLQEIAKETVTETDSCAPVCDQEGRNCEVGGGSCDSCNCR